MNDTGSKGIHLIAKNIGSFRIPDGKVDIADPGIDRGNYTSLDIKPGDYYCLTYTEDSGAPTVWASLIVHQDEFGKGKTGVREIGKTEHWTEVAKVNVYSGMAGFFASKPDFAPEVWEGICYSLALDNSNAYIRSFIHGQKVHDGFFTNSGIGDGTYPVYAIYKRNKIVALEIRFYLGGIAK